MKYTFTNNEMDRMLYILRNVIAQPILQEWNPDHIPAGFTVPSIDNPDGFNDQDLLDSILAQRT